MQRGLRFRCTLTASLLIFVLVLVGCGSSESRSVSEAGSPTDSPTETTEPTSGEKTSAQVASSEAEENARSFGEFASCQPTQPDMLGPFYEPDTPVRTSVGSGYLLSGAVLAAGSCEPIHDAQIEFWLANPEGVYDDAHRATVPAEGEYRFESNVPVAYENRPPHIHVRVTAPGYQELVTQHYPNVGQTEANFNLILRPIA